MWKCVRVRRCDVAFIVHTHKAQKEQVREIAVHAYIFVSVSVLVCVRLCKCPLFIVSLFVVWLKSFFVATCQRRNINSPCSRDTPLALNEWGETSNRNKSQWERMRNRTCQCVCRSKRKCIANNTCTHIELYSSVPVLRQVYQCVFLLVRSFFSSCTCPHVCHRCVSYILRFKKCSLWFKKNVNNFHFIIICLHVFLLHVSRMLKPNAQRARQKERKNWNIKLGEWEWDKKKKKKNRLKNVEKQKTFEYPMLYSKFNQNFSPFIRNFSLILE